MKLKQKCGTILDAIGNTPLVRLQNLSFNPQVTILVKLEFLNPGFSIKDRIVKYIIEDAERTGKLSAGGTIVENTSGNTGAAAAMIAAIKGYRAILTMPDKVSVEKQNSLKAYGAEIVVCPTDVPPDSPEHYVNKAKKIAEDIQGAFRINQYDNLKNPEAHYRSTAPEIWEQTGGDIDYFIASASTGGTISGIGKYLKERNPKIKVIMPDPVGSVYYDYFHKGSFDTNARCNYFLEGIGEDHLAKAIDFGVIDDVVQVKDKDAFATARLLARKEGIFAGGSTGANIWAALELSKKLKNNATIVTVAPDAGVKYLSKIYDDTWLDEHQLM